MKYLALLLILLFLLSSCLQEKSKDDESVKDELFFSIQGSWEGYRGEPIWRISSDSIFYYTENKSYYYFIHENEIIVLYKKGPYIIKNLKISEDTLFFSTGGVNATMLRSDNENSGQTFNSREREEHAHRITNRNNEILGEWGYNTRDRLFSWEFSRDSINYKQSGERYYYIQHDSSLIILTDKDAIIMKDIIVNQDTLQFRTNENTLITAYRKSY